MKKLLAYSISAALIAGTTLTGCYPTSPSNYYGTMTGAHIGGMVGEGIGFVSTRGSFAGGLLGSVVGTVAGAAIGNNISNRANRANQQRQQQRRQNDQNQYDYDSYDNGSYDNDNEISDYQIEGGANISATENFNITNIIVSDPNNNGVLDKEETMELVCEITNVSNTDSEVVISTGNADIRHLTFSPSIKTTINAGKSVRYTSKIYCEKVPSGDYIDIPVTVSSATLGTTTSSVRLLLK